ncbi:MAG: nucleotidyl transferase AbiEii/AbiGii toxin family protein [Verrucomicrobiota bacterium]
MNENPQSPSNHLLELLTQLVHSGVRFIVAGGVAAVLHGVERMTMDVDLAIEETPENVRRFLAAMTAIGLTPRAPVPPQILLDRPALDCLVEEKGALVLAFYHPLMPWLQVDVFLSRDASFSALKDFTQDISLGDITIRVVSAQQLIAMKRRVQPMRAKDHEDIDALEKIAADGNRDIHS